MTGAEFCIYVYDCTNSESLTAIPSWVERVKKANGGKSVSGKFKQ